MMSEEILIAMQENLGMGHSGRILVTTQRRVDTNQEPIACDIHRDYAIDICRRWNCHKDLLEACHNLANTMAIDMIIKKLSISEDIDDLGYATILKGIQQQAKRAEGKAQPSKQSVGKE